MRGLESEVVWNYTVYSYRAFLPSCNLVVVNELYRGERFFSIVYEKSRLTPPPTGDTPWELALDVLGDDLVIFGILDPSIFISGPAGDIEPALDTLYTPRLRRSNFVLWPAADGIAVPQERFEAVARWMDRNRRG